MENLSEKDTFFKPKEREKISVTLLNDTFFVIKSMKQV